MGYRRFNLIVISVAASLCAVIVTLNYVLDPFGLFKRDFLKQKRAPMERFIKMRHIVNNPAKYDSFLFGSSRVGKIDVHRIKGGHYYNMNYSEAVPGEYLKDIHFLISRNVVIKNLLIGLDDFSYKVDPATHLTSAMRRPYGSTLENVRVYMECLLAMPRTTWIREWLDKKPGKVFYDIHESGMVLHKQEDVRIERNIYAHVNHKKFRKPFYYRGDRIRETIDDILEIKRLCNANNIYCMFFINPIHKTTYLDGDPLQLDRFKRELVTITDFYDFSGFNSITIDNYCYYETSHYRYFVADLVLARIYGDDSLTVPEDFGVLVNKNNIDAHLHTLKQRQESSDLLRFSERFPQSQPAREIP
jgi:hypothetical protein